MRLSNGQIGYTRNGEFKKGPDGRIQDSNGNVLQPEIVVPPNADGHGNFTGRPGQCGF